MKRISKGTATIAATAGMTPAMKRMAFALVFALATAMAMAAVPARAATTTSTTYDVPAATATAPLLCTDCGPLPTYTITYTGNGTCSATCSGFPVDPADLTLTFAVARFFPPSPCMMKSGTGTLSASWPSDPSLPTAQGTFTFKARDSHIVDFSGSITASSLSVLPAGEVLGGSVTYPPSPCTGAPPKPSSASEGKRAPRRQTQRPAAHVRPPRLPGQTPIGHGRASRPGRFHIVPRPAIPTPQPVGVSANVANPSPRICSLGGCSTHDGVGPFTRSRQIVDHGCKGQATQYGRCGAGPHKRARREHA